jgi:hypothetical protein
METSKLRKTTSEAEGRGDTNKYDISNNKQKHCSTLSSRVFDVQCGLQSL